MSRDGRGLPGIAADHCLQVADWEMNELQLKGCTPLVGDQEQVRVMQARW
jgi:hypothetical protein